LSGVGLEDAPERRQLLDERADALRQRQPQDRGQEVGLRVERKLARYRFGLFETPARPITARLTTALPRRPP
jgi:hypothetical protein